MQLTRAEEIVTVDEAAGCLLIEVLSHLHGEDHDHEEAHAHVEGEPAGEDTMTEEGHGHDDDRDDDHDRDHEVAKGGDAHSEFHARYVYDCTDSSAIASVGFPFFDAFENAEEIEARYATASGSGAGELERGGATLALD